MSRSWHVFVQSYGGVTFSVRTQTRVPQYSRCVLGCVFCVALYAGSAVDRFRTFLNRYSTLTEEEVSEQVRENREPIHTHICPVTRPVTRPATCPVTCPVTCPGCTVRTAQQNKSGNRHNLVTRSPCHVCCVAMCGVPGLQAQAQGAQLYGNLVGAWDVDLDGSVGQDDFLELFK